MEDNKNSGQLAIERELDNLKKANSSLDKKVSELHLENSELQKQLNERMEDVQKREHEEMLLEISIKNGIPQPFREYLKGETREELEKNAKELGQKVKENWSYNNQKFMLEHNYIPKSGIGNYYTPEKTYSDYEQMSDYEKRAFRKRNPGKISEWLLENAKAVLK